MNMCNAASIFANSFTWDSSSILLVCFILEINDHLLDYDCDFGSKKKDKKDSETSIVIPWKSLNMLTIAMA